MVSKLSKLPWLIYAMGGGWGHLNRAIAIGQLAAKTRPVTILSNSPYASIIQAKVGTGLLDIQAIPPETTESYVRTELLNLLTDSPSILIVDALPRGLWGELATILPQLHSLPRILVLQDIPLEYVLSRNLEDFVANYYDLVVVPGRAEDPPFEDRVELEWTDPWLIRHPDDLPTRAGARHLLRIEPTHLLSIVICASGNQDELEIYGYLAKALSEILPWVAVRCLAAACPSQCPPQVWIPYWPAMDCLPGADIVISGAGYNTFYECMALGIPLVAFPWDRIYDRQRARAEKASTLKLGDVTIVTGVQDAISAVCNLLNQMMTHSPDLTVPEVSQPRAYLNGTIEALKLIEESLERKGEKVIQSAIRQDIDKLQNRSTSSSVMV